MITVIALIAAPKRMKKSLKTSIPADPSQWSEKSKQSDFRGLQYCDRHYTCRHCQADSIFTAQDQQHRFEVKKAYVHQHRVLGHPCWLEADRLRARLRGCEDRWLESTAERQTDQAFLAHWLELLVALETYRLGKPDTAKKSMLAKLLAPVPI